MIKLWLDDVRPAPNESWRWAKTVEDAINIMYGAALVGEEVGYASLDHDLGAALPPGMSVRDSIYLAGASQDGSGLDFVKWMVDNDCWPTGEIVVHSWNRFGATRMCSLIDEHGPYEHRTKYIPYDVRRYTESEV